MVPLALHVRLVSAARIITVIMSALSLSGCGLLGPKDAGPPEPTAEQLRTVLAEHDAEKLDGLLIRDGNDAAKIIKATRNFEPDDSAVVHGSGDGGGQCVWITGRVGRAHKYIMTKLVATGERDASWKVAPDYLPSMAASHVNPCDGGVPPEMAGYKRLA